MNYTLEDVKKFIEEFTELEYQVEITSYDNSVSEEEWLYLVVKLRSFYGQQFQYYATVRLVNRSPTVMTEDVLNKQRKNLKKRRLFLIRKHENPVFGKGILNTDANVLFSCFLGANVDMGAEVYPNNLSVGIVEGELKVITERDLNSEKRRREEIIEWVDDKKSNVYLEGIIIKKDGKLVDTLKVFEPEHPTWLADYNS